MSSVEANYRAMVKGIQELLWLKRLKGEFGFSLYEPIKLFYDNQSAIRIAKNPIQREHTKHVRIECNFIYEKFEDKIIEVPYMKNIKQLVDVLTNVVSTQTFSNSLVKMAIQDIYAPS